MVCNLFIDFPTMITFPQVLDWRKTQTCHKKRNEHSYNIHICQQVPQKMILEASLGRKGKFVLFTGIDYPLLSFIFSVWFFFLLALHTTSKGIKHYDHSLQTANESKLILCTVKRPKFTSISSTRRHLLQTKMFQHQKWTITIPQPPPPSSPNPCFT